MKETFIKKFTNDEGLMFWKMNLPYNFFDSVNITNILGHEDNRISCSDLIIKFIEKTYNVTTDDFVLEEWRFNFYAFCITVKIIVNKGSEYKFMKLNPKWCN